MVFPIGLRYIFTTKVIVLIKWNNIPPKTLVTTLLTAVTTLRLGKDTSISNTNSQLVTVG